MSRILFIITQSEIGGAQRYLLELAPYLTQKGHKIIVATGEGDGELFSQLNQTGSDPVQLNVTIPNLVRSLNPIKDARALFSILKIIKKEGPNILFLQSTKAGFLGSLAAQLYKAYCFVFHVPCSMNIVYRIGGWAFRDPRPWYMNKIVFWMEKVSARWKDVIIVNSEFDYQIALDKKISSASKIVKIYNGIDTSRLKILPKEEALSKITKHKSQITTNSIAELATGQTNKSQSTNPKSQTLLVGTIANLYATKGIDYLIEAAYILTKNYNLKPITYIVIGEGPERPKLEALIKNCNLEKNFFLLGNMPDARQYLRAFDIFVLPSVKEGFPWVLLEAMAAEVPIIATRVGAVPEVIENKKEGLLVPPRNSEALAEKIFQLLSKQSVHDREQMATNAKEALKRFNLRKMLEKSEQAINDIPR